MAYIVFSPRQLAKAEKMRLPAQSPDLRDSLASDVEGHRICGGADRAAAR
jgi:hypothetical protein